MTRRAELIAIAYNEMCFMALFDKSFYYPAIAERYYKLILRSAPRRERRELLQAFLAHDKIHYYGGTI